MADDREPTPKPEDKVPGDATPHNPGVSPKPSDPTGQSKPADVGPYEKEGDPAQQPS